jgi:hypothetical protein
MNFSWTDLLSVERDTAYQNESSHTATVNEFHIDTKIKTLSLKHAYRQLLVIKSNNLAYQQLQEPGATQRRIAQSGYHIP